MEDEIWKDESRREIYEISRPDDEAGTKKDTYGYMYVKFNTISNTKKNIHINNTLKTAPVSTTNIHMATFAPWQLRGCMAPSVLRYHVS